MVHLKTNQHYFVVVRRDHGCPIDPATEAMVSSPGSLVVGVQPGRVLMAIYTVSIFQTQLYYAGYRSVDQQATAALGTHLTRIGELCIGRDCTIRRRVRMGRCQRLRVCTT